MHVLIYSSKAYNIVPDNLPDIYTVPSFQLSGINLLKHLLSPPPHLTGVGSESSVRIFWTESEMCGMMNASSVSLRSYLHMTVRTTSSEKHHSRGFIYIYIIEVITSFNSVEN